ncbi:MAG TPA: SRPBCC family protein [Terriglobales bacterium]
MPNETFDTTSSESRTSDRERQGKSSSSAKRRNAFLITGSSALAFGLWKRGRIGWPALIGGAALLARAAAEGVSRYFSCEVSQTIHRSPSEVYTYLRDLNNWPIFMRELKDARELDLAGSDRLRWSDGTRNWNASIGDSSTGESLQWTFQSDDQWRECRVELNAAPGNRGTEVHWRLRAQAPQNLLADILRSTYGSGMEQGARESLRAIKQLLEAGELATTDGQSHGSRGATGRVKRAMFRESVDAGQGRRRPQRIPPQRVAS